MSSRSVAEYSSLIAIHVAITSGSRAQLAATQGLTLVHFFDQRKHFLWDTLGTISRLMGHNSSQTEPKTSH